MSEWKIDVHGVSLTLTALGDRLGLEGGGFSSTIDSTSDGIDMALKNVKSPPVEHALSGFLTHFASETDAMFIRSMSCLKGANDATLAYNEGQEEMALEAQNQAGTGENLDLGGGDGAPANAEAY
ncbi:DUF6507 family protein [Nocardiopsis lambiniae]|uniref:DUF6507 family protein n=1 Tax=Nocardiopsis lambiniae TaxID=3075539 RepID=A0ABU2MGC0_9ACTN|nr:DUF6507 family protein [Nocardiopsis sp. DSM 44743]MDT0331741.1 DUF6507 family protein [Nocardiopsis sp. DSM 44743]